MIMPNSRRLGDYYYALSFEVFRELNQKRQAEFKNTNGELVSKQPEWTPIQWYIALIGEIGEYSNVVKKYFRRDYTENYFLDEAGKELADVQTYLSLLTNCYDFTLASHRKYLPDFIFNYFEQKDYSVDDIGEGLYNLFIEINAIGSHIMVEHENDKNAIFFHLCQAQYNLEMLANMSGVDLAKATFEKWNNVSRRVGSEIVIPEHELSIKGIC